MPLDSVGSGANGYYAIVICDDHLARHVLPASGVVTVGRSEDAGVCVPHLSVSRLHARVCLGDALTVEDLGSSNGTRLGGTRVKKGVAAEFAPGDVVELGAAMMVIKPLSGTGASWMEGADDGNGVSAAGTGARRTRVVVVSDAMRKLHRLVKRVAASPLTVLILGETGAGKEIIAELVHEHSPRALEPFLRLNCATFPENLLESELFGHVRGAFTGASRDKPGLLESAHGGTVFLDEIAELTPAVQAKLLRAIEEQQILRLGSVEPRSIDVRFVAATNQDVQAYIRGGRFREDLFYRINGITISVPPLRERPEEIEALALSFATRLSEELGVAKSPTLSGEALDLLLEHDWPGNVRELRNVVERAIILCDGDAVLDTDIRFERSQPGCDTEESSVAEPATIAPGRPGEWLRTAIEDTEREQIVAALDACSGNQSMAAKRLGISRSTLLRRMARYGIRREPSKRSGS